MKKLIIALLAVSLISCDKEVVEPPVAVITQQPSELLIGNWDRTYQETVTDGTVTYSEIDTDNGYMSFGVALITWYFEDSTSNILGSYLWDNDSTFTIGTGTTYYIDLINDQELVMHFNTNESVSHRLYYDRK